MRVERMHDSWSYVIYATRLYRNTQRVWFWLDVISFDFHWLSSSIFWYLLAPRVRRTSALTVYVYDTYLEISQNVSIEIEVKIYSSPFECVFGPNINKRVINKLLCGFTLSSNESSSTIEHQWQKSNIPYPILIEWVEHILNYWKVSISKI